ncbi:ELM2 domain protein [Theileria parva strain Muguga]|uniref:ELM2 domain-containing protein n=1 Tax=Theileria parva TaxID=5875 RepID=Q4N902_THEPA|nr:ELM2 domain protein [Theileria parva strain Muguga]EAN33556.1 ELM2 domain protein [Theileria parva strain Muguga]|eukprot:XP_765839.1 hypothetical protein [Theileria parva strain Muguga]
METKRQWMQSFDGRIRVGPEYQAMIPPFCKNYQSHQNDINPKDTQEPKPPLTQSHSDPLQSHQSFTESYQPFTQSYEPFTESYEQLTESLHQCEEYENVDLEDQCDISSHIKFVSEEELGRFESDTKSLEHYNSDKEF